MDRITDVERDAHLHRARVLQRLPGLSAACLALFGIAVALGLTSAHPLSGVFPFVFPVTVVLYVLPWMHRLPAPLRPTEYRRIKEIPLAKAFYVPACWTLFALWAAPFFPSAKNGQIASAMLFLFPPLFITCSGCDLRDEVADRNAGILTFPVLLGRHGTVAMLRVVQLGSMAVFVLLWVLGFASSVAAIFALSGLPVFLCLGRLARPEADAVFYSDIVFDLLWVFQPLPAAAATWLMGSWP